MLSTGPTCFSESYPRWLFSMVFRWSRGTRRYERSLFLYLSYQGLRTERRDHQGEVFLLQGEPLRRVPRWSRLPWSALIWQVCSICLGYHLIHISQRGVSANLTMIIKQVGDENNLRRYNPNSDFSLKTRYVPNVINETISPKNESDRCHMLLQAMVYIRVGNYLRTSPDLVILCFYLNTKFEAERYLVYQATDNINRVCAPTAIRQLFWRVS